MTASFLKKTVGCANGDLFFENLTNSSCLSGNVLKEIVTILKSAFLEEESQLMGWKLDEPESPRGLPRGVLEVILKIIGILITSLAVAMGAPFWFDLTRKMLGVRKYIQQPQLLIEERRL